MNIIALVSSKISSTILYSDAVLFPHWLRGGGLQDFSPFPKIQIMTN